MDYQNYDDYMRNTLGFSNTNCPNMYMNTQNPYQTTFQVTDNLERMYPETYRIIYPMIVSSCNMISMPITEEMIDRMTDDIYDRAIADSRINVDINVEVETRDDNSKQTSDESRQRRPRRNPIFRDLIRILLLREILGRRQRFPFRPF